MRTVKKIGLGLLAVLLAAGAFAFALRPQAGPCAEPELPVPRSRVVACAEHYVRAQWYTSRWGQLVALDADPHGHGSWAELMSTHRGTLRDELSALCTHPRDAAGALGATALFEAARAGGQCRAFAVTPLLGVTVKEQPCDAVRAQLLCIPRDEAVRGR